MVIHCSPGTGRTGSVIACDIAIREFELTRQVDIPKIVYKIRRDRASSVQTRDQYAFIYKVCKTFYFKKIYYSYLKLIHFPGNLFVCNQTNRRRIRFNLKMKKGYNKRNFKSIQCDICIIGTKFMLV